MRVGLSRMGQKYIPSVRDHKAAARFLQKQRPAPDFTKSSHALKPAAADTPPPSAPADKPAAAKPAAKKKA